MRRSIRTGLSSVSSLVMPLALLLLFLFGPTLATSALADTFGGRAFSAFVNAPTLGAGPMHLSDTGELSPYGGWEGAGVLGVQVPNVLSASVLNAATSGATGKAASSSSLADIVVLPGQLAELTASFVGADARSTDLGSSGTTEIHSLRFGGRSIDVTGAKNQRIDLPGPLGQMLATLVINEQIETTVGSSRGIVVNALHLTLVTGEQIVLGSAKSFLDPAGDVTLASAETNPGCGPRLVPAAAHPPGTEICLDFVTGGGFFEPPNSNRPGRVNFGFNAGPRSLQDPEPKGHLNLVDHADGTHVKGTTVDTYYVYGGDPDHCRIFGGDAEVDGVGGHRYLAGVCDYGEPGRDDRFQLVVTLGGEEVYRADNFDGTPPPAGGELDGGNIQLHVNKNKCTQETRFDGGPGATLRVRALRTKVATDAID